MQGLRPLLGIVKFVLLQHTPRNMGRDRFLVPSPVLRVSRNHFFGLKLTAVVVCATPRITVFVFATTPNNPYLVAEPHPW